MPSTPLLDSLALPDGLRTLDADALREVAAEVRAEMIDAVSQTGGHLGVVLAVIIAILSAVQFKLGNKDN